MKSMKVFGAILMMAVLMFTSCLGDGSNKQSAETVGVVRYDYKTAKYLLDTYGWGVFYSPSLNSTPDIREGACYYFSFELDFDIPENDRDVVNTTGYYTITMGQKYEISRYSMSPVFTDTTTVLTNEIPLVNSLAYAYVKGIFFLQHTFKQPEDQNYTWSLSYNTQDMVVEEGNNRIYDIFIRASISGSPGTKTPTDGGVANAYDMKYYIESAAAAEKNLNKDIVNIRLNYVSEIKDENIVWKKTEVVPVSIDLILSEDN